MEDIVFIVVLILFTVCVVWATVEYMRRRSNSRTIIYEVRSPEDFDDVIFDDFWDDPSLDTLTIKKKA